MHDAAGTSGRATDRACKRYLREYNMSRNFFDLSKRTQERTGQTFFYFDLKAESNTYVTYLPEIIDCNAESITVRLSAFLDKNAVLSLQIELDKQKPKLADKQHMRACNEISPEFTFMILDEYADYLRVIDADNVICSPSPQGQGVSAIQFTLMPEKLNDKLKPQDDNPNQFNNACNLHKRIVDFCNQAPKSCIHTTSLGVGGR